VKSESHIPTDTYNREHPLLANPGETQLMHHMPQLDGVRALAVLAVLWWHFMPRTIQQAGAAPWGAIGVGLFFTLSGFLITRILLNCRLQIEEGSSSIPQMLRQFYMRRFLRIFPLYYAVLAVLAVLNVTEIRDRIWWHLAYLSNVRFSYWPKSNEIERHLWSLSVEEQFYLLWPLLIFLAPRRFIGPMVLLTVIAAPIWRITTYTRGQFGHEWMMPGCLDLLGLGALLALLSLPKFGLARWFDRLVNLCGLIGVPLFIIYVTMASMSVKGSPGDAVTISQGLGWQTETIGRRGFTSFAFDWPGGSTYTITALFSVWLIGMAARGFQGPLGYALASSPMVYIGRISYGLYVLHMFVPHLIDHLFPGRTWAPSGTWSALVLYTVVSIGFASISWYAFEAPINGLKRHFEYDRKR
jgi:peptidoglycan/LPS O-acetylase OafA/YrhL